MKFADRQSAIAQVVHGEQVAWGTNEYLLAVLVDLAQMQLWTKTKDAESGRNPPKPIRRPGEAPDEIRYGNAAMTLAETKAWLDSRREHPDPMTMTEVVT